MVKRVALVTGLLLAGAATAGELPASTRAATLHVIDEAVEVELLSLEPHAPECRDTRTAMTEECFYGAKILGRADAAPHADVLFSELRGWAEAPWHEGDAMCFNPHHGIVVRAKEHRFAFLICYSCGKTQVYRGDSRYWFGEFEATRSVEPINAAVEALGLPLPSPYALR